MNLNGDGIDIPTNVTELFNLTFNNASGTTLQNDLSINNILSLTSGNFAIGSNLLSIYGDYTTTGGTLTGDATSDMYIGYTDTYTTTAKFNQKIIAYNEIEADNLLTNMQKNNSSSISGSDNGNISKIMVPIYAPKEPAPEFTLHELTLNNLTIERQSGVVLDGNLDLAGNFILNYGTFNAGEFDVSVAGNYTNTATYLQTTGTLTFDDNTNTELQTYGLGSGFGGKTDYDNFSTYNVYGLYFDTYEDFLLKSVKVYAASAGDITVSWRDGSGTIVEQATITVPVGESRIPLNFNITAGTDLQLNLESGAVNLYFDHQGTVAYPYAIGSLGQINRDNIGTTDYYFFFYDWEFEQEIQGNTDFNNVVLNKEGADLLLNQDIQINNEFTVFDGTVSTYTVTQTGIHYNTDATLSYAGTYTQTTSDYIFPTVDAPTNLNIQNTAGVYLHADRAIAGNMDLEGILNLGDYNFTMGLASTYSGTASNTAMVVPNGAGEFRKMFDADGAFTFPVGDVEYSPVTLDFMGGTYSTTSYAAVNNFAQKHAENTDANNFINRYWSVSQTDITNYTCTATFTYADNDIVGTETYMDGAQWTGTAWVNTNIDYATNKISGIFTDLGDFTAKSKTMQDFTVTVYDYNATLLEGANVDFDVFSDVTIADGTATFSVPVDETYDYIVNPNNSCSATYSGTATIEASTTNIDVYLLSADVIAPDMLTIADATGECSVDLSTYTPTTTDNCAGTVTGTTSDALFYDVQGTYTITWTFDDGNGNSIDVNQNVIIADVTNPTITCVDNQVIDLLEGQTSYSVTATEFDAIGNDNCNVANIVNDFNSTATLAGEALPPGTYTITWTVTDDAGNTEICNSEIIINAYVGLNDISLISVTLYPNPSNGIFTIENAIGFDIVISDVQGKIIHTQKLVNHITKIDLSNYANGIYFIKFSNKDAVKTMKLIKNQ